MATHLLGIKKADYHSQLFLWYIFYSETSEFENS